MEVARVSHFLLLPEKKRPNSTLDFEMIKRTKTEFGDRMGKGGCCRGGGERSETKMQASLLYRQLTQKRGQLPRIAA